MNEQVMIDAEVAKLTRYKFAHAAIRHGQAGVEDALRGYSPLLFYVPEGVVPEVRPVNDDERDAFQKLRQYAPEGANVPDITDVVTFPYGWMYGKRDAGGVPMPVMFHHGVHIYTDGLDKAEQTPDRSTPLEWASLMMTNPNNDQIVGPVEGEPGQLTENMRNLTLMMALGMLARRTSHNAGRAVGKRDVDKEMYGDDLVVDDRDPEANGFAKFEALRFVGTGKVAIQNKHGESATMRVFGDGGLYVIMEPGTEVERIRLTPEQIASYIDGFDGLDFNPVEVIAIPNAGIIDKQQGDGATGDYQLALAEKLYVACEPGAVVQMTHAWAPKLPFEENGATNFLDAKPDVPTPDEVMAALNEVQSQFAIAA